MFFIWCFNFSIFTLIAFIALYLFIFSMNLHEFQHSSFQMPFSILWLCDTVCLFTFHFTVMLIANPFPSVSVSRRTLESLQCSPGRSETGLRHAWSSLKYVSLRERERERERDPSRLISCFCVTTFYDTVENILMFLEALWGVWTNICFVLVGQDRTMKSVKLCQINKW